MSPFWLLPQQVCVEAENSVEAAGIGEKITGKEVMEAKHLPYPATPRIGEQSNCPSFCMYPNTCAGRQSCPRSYACSE